MVNLQKGLEYIYIPYGEFAEGTRRVDRPLLPIPGYMQTDILKRGDVLRTWRDTVETTDLNGARCM